MMASLKIVFSITLWSTFLLMVILFNPFLVLRQRKKKLKLCHLYASGTLHSVPFMLVSELLFSSDLK